MTDCSEQEELFYSSNSMEKLPDIMEINEYLIISKIGESKHSIVYFSKNMKTGEYFALKRIYLKSLYNEEAGILKLEKDINSMREIKNENIIELHNVLHIEDLEYVFLVLDYADCGSLQHVIELGVLKINEIKYIFSMILKAICYLHNKGIVFHNIKPSNILLCSDGRVLLADCCFCNSITNDTAYKAPEVLNESEFLNVEIEPSKEDVWSLGICLYQSLFGITPFNDKKSYHCPLVIPEGTNKEITELINGMLCITPEKRMDINMIMNTDFFSNHEVINHFDFPIIKNDFVHNEN